MNKNMDLTGESEYDRIRLSKTAILSPSQPHRCGDIVADSAFGFLGACTANW